MHPCQLVYKAAGLTPPETGNYGTCRVTGAQTYGVYFDDWIASREKFNDFATLRPGNIMSHEALFTFDEQSLLLAQKTNRDKPQRFRTYCHIITATGEWYALTKADKKLMFTLLTASQAPQVVSLTDTGQRHLFFKNRLGFWQLDDHYILPNVPLFTQIHANMMHLLTLGFTQTEVHSGNYNGARVAAAGLETWKQAESKIKAYRKQPIFDMAAWLMYAV